MRISRQTVSDGPGGVGTSRSGEDVKVLRPGDIRRIQERHALVIAGNAPPIIARLRRCLDGKDGKLLKAELDEQRARVVASRAATASLEERTAAAVAHAHTRRLAPSHREPNPTGAAGADEPTKRWAW